MCESQGECKEKGFVCLKPVQESFRRLRKSDSKDDSKDDSARTCHRRTTCNMDNKCSPGYKCFRPRGEKKGTCQKDLPPTCSNTPGMECGDGSTCHHTKVCQPMCNNEMNICDDPHMQGLRGQTIDWSGVDGGWYNLIKDEESDIFVNLRTTAPLPREFPDRQLITGVSILSAGHSIVIEVKNPYDVNTGGCPAGVSPCLANGGLRALVDGSEDDSILQPLKEERVVEGIDVSAFNLPVECRHFGGDKIWARLYDDMLQGKRELRAEDTFADWLLGFQTMAAPDWCARYIDQHGLENVQSTYAVFKIVTSASTVHIDVGTNYQGNGEQNWDGRVLPNIEFWQMNVGIDGLVLEHESLSGLLGETARPVIDENGQAIMHGYEAFRGTVEDYRVDGPLDKNFVLLRL